MFVQQFFVGGLAHSSYLLGGTENCAIVDPRRDVGIYVEAARRMGMRITHILETHLHADFISGHLDLARMTGARIYAPKSARCKFKHVPVAEGTHFGIDDLRIGVIETPGHTPEHISYVVSDKARGDEPACVFCGDTLFVGDVGRPDLFPGKARMLATKLYASLHEKLMKLPDFCEVLPAHGAGSLCGRAMGAKRTSTIGYERRYNAALQIRELATFISSLTNDMPPAPDHFSRCSAINGRGPALVGSLPKIEALGPTDFRKAMAHKRAVVLDTRDYQAFAGAHVPRSFHIGIGGNFPTFAGWVLPKDAEILIVADDLATAEGAQAKLRMVGQDRATAYLDGGIFAWAKEGFDTSGVRLITPRDLASMVRRQRGMTLVDVRAPVEFKAEHIKGAINIPAPDLRRAHKRLNPHRPVVVICSTGHRSSLAASILKRRGFGEVINVAGGMTGYSAAGLAKECPVCMAPHLPRFMGA